VPLLFAALFGPLAWARHHWLGSWTYDLGIKAQLLYNCTRGRWLESSVEVQHYFGDHLNPTFLLLTPLYGLLPYPGTLILFQCVFFAVGGVIVARLTARWLPGEPSLVIPASAAYLFQCSAGNLILYDFHETAMASTFILLAIYAFQSERTILGLVATCLSVGCKETGGLDCAAVGTWLAVSRRRRLLGTFMIAGGLAYTYLAVAVIMPFFRGGRADSLEHYAHLGTTPGEMIGNIFARPYNLPKALLHPVKLLYVAILLLPALFVPLRYPRTLLPAVWVILPNLLSTRQTQYLARYQYDACVIPFLALAMLECWPRLLRGPASQRSRRKLILATVLALLLSNANSTVFGWAGYVLPNVTRRAAFNELARLIPPEAPLSASLNLGPHLVRRQFIDYPSIDWPIDRFPDLPHRRARYALIDFLFEARHFRTPAAEVRQRLAGASYALEVERNGFALYRLVDGQT